MSDSALQTLREIRQVLREAETLKRQRKVCIRQAQAEGHSERRIALAAGISKGQVHRLLVRD